MLFLMINNIFLFLGGFCLLALGIGMYQGRSGLAEEGASG